MVFTLNHEDVFEGFDKIEDGTYEVIIEKVNEDANKNTGTEFINFQMVIRNDLDQPFKNQKLWHRAWKSKETKQYNQTIFNTIGKAAGLQNGKTYKSLRELLDDYEGKPVQVFVKNETSQYNGQTYENLNVKSWKPSAFPNIQHQFKGESNQATSAPQVDISDENLPF